MLKPAEQTPLSALRLAELAAEAGFPPGVVNIINGFGETAGAALCVHPDVDKIAFTGHVDTAKIIQKATADTLKRTSMNWEAKARMSSSPMPIWTKRSPAPSMPSTSMAANAARRAADFLSKRRFATSSSRVWRPRPARESSAIRSTQPPSKDRKSPTSRWTKSSGMSPGTKARCQTGLWRQTGRSAGYFVEPTIFDGVRDDMAIAQDEIFGPVVSILPFKSAEEVFDRANRTYYGLAAAFWTKDIDKAHLLPSTSRRELCGSTATTSSTPSTPFGGFKMSGHGRENGEAAPDSTPRRKPSPSNLRGNSETMDVPFRRHGWRIR